MRALTIRQPWASLIALGIKRYETRSRPTKVRGRIAIHAGLARPGAVEIAAVHQAAEIDPRRMLLRRRMDWHWYPLPLGAVVATAELTDCISTTEGGTASELALGDWTPGRWAWLLDDVRPLAAPVPAKGRQGWWDWMPEGGV